MAMLKPLPKSIFCLSFGAATAALVLAFLMIAVAGQPAQAQTFQVIHSFTGGGDGATPWAGVTLDKAGNLYGTASAGGIGYGTVYRLQHKGSGWTFNPLYSFTGGVDGDTPLARVIFGPDGGLFGTTVHGAGGSGTVFNLRPQATACKTSLCSWAETVLYRFSALSNYHPDAEVTFDQAGSLYSTTLYSGSGDCPEGCGVVFELTPPGSWNMETVLYSFSGTDGEHPNGVIFDNAGNLYGTTRAGGLGGYGTVFELMYPGWSQQCSLYNFRRGNDGGDLLAGLIFDQSGNLYGATIDGGSGGGGTVFELTPLDTCSWTLQTLYSFTGPAECGPYGTLAIDGAGNLYGTTYCDGAHNAGNVFKLTYPNWTYTSLYDFTGGNDGAYPVSNVVIDGSGNLYGTASEGGLSGNCDGFGCGVVWEITPN